MAYNSFVTEYFLAQNFSPKSGVTPGTDNQRWMTCDEILARYNVNISGITSTGLRWPSEGEITALPLFIVRTAYYYTTLTQVNPGGILLDLGYTFNLLIVSIATQDGGTRSGGAPTYNGIPMTYINGVGKTEMYYLNYNGGDGQIYVPNTSNAKIQIVADLCQYLGNLHLNDSVADNAYGEIFSTVNMSSSSKNLIISAVSIEGEYGVSNLVATDTPYFINQNINYYLGVYVRSNFSGYSSYTLGWHEYELSPLMDHVVACFYVD